MRIDINLFRLFTCGLLLFSRLLSIMGKKEDKEARVAIVNEIIKEIASRGRGFFKNKESGKIAELFIRKGKVYYRCEWVFRGLEEICLSTAEYNTPKGWFHGGTLLGLVRDFKDFIITGGKTNAANGYGGLYCAHWGYKENDMIAIREKAIELGYLDEIEDNEANT